MNNETLSHDGRKRVVVSHLILRDLPSFIATSAVVVFQGFHT